MKTMCAADAEQRKHTVTAATTALVRIVDAAESAPNIGRRRKKKSKTNASAVNTQQSRQRNEQSAIAQSSFVSQRKRKSWAACASCVLFRFSTGVKTDKTPRKRDFRDKPLAGIEVNRSSCLPPVSRRNESHFLSSDSDAIVGVRVPVCGRLCLAFLVSVAFLITFCDN